MPQVGEVQDGYRFVGGDPSQANSWEKVKEQSVPDYQKMFQGEPNKALGAMLQLSQGSSFGFGEEAVAALAALTTDKPYTEHLESLRSQMGQFQEQNPMTSLGLNVAGGLTQGLGLAGLAPKAIAQLPNILKIPLLAGAGGALSGAGTALEGERLGGAATGATIGAATGLAMAGAGALIKSPLRWLQSQFRSPNKNAQQSILKALERDGFTPQQAQDKLKQLGKNATLADLGPNTQALAGVIAREPSQAKTKAVEFFEQRARTIPNRLIPSIRTITGNDKNAFDTMKGIIQRRSAQSAPLYKDAYSQAVPTENMQRVLNGIDDLAQGREGSSIGRALLSWKNKLTEGNKPRTTVRQLDAIKQDLDDQIGTLFRTGKNARGAALLDVKRLLLSEMDTAVPVYAQARGVFSSESRLKDALILGKRILRDDFDEMSALVTDMSQAEKEVFVTGAIKTIRDKFLSAKIGNNSARLLSAPLLRERLRNVFPDDQSFKAFMSQLDTEELFQGTRAEILKGSQTAARQAAESTLKQEARLGFTNYAKDVIEDLTGRPKSQTVEAIGDRLFTTSPNLEELEKVIPSLTEKQRQQLMDAMVITTGNQAGQF